LSSAFKRRLVDVTLDIIKTLLKGYFIAGFFFPLAHFETASILKFNGLTISGKVSMTNVMGAT
jgi:hypothetical protein